MKKPSAQSGGLFIVDIPQKHIIILALRPNSRREVHTKKPAPKKAGRRCLSKKLKKFLEYMVVSFSILGVRNPTGHTFTNRFGIGGYTIGF